MKSNWELTKQRSEYHFDTHTIDSRWDTVQLLGHVTPNWSAELAKAIDASQPVTWRTRGRPNDAKVRSSEEHDREEYDLQIYGMDKDYVVSNLNYAVAPVFQQLADQFALEDSMCRIHVQYPGQVWNLHLDKLEKWMPTDPDRVVRYFVQLTDWQPGHFWNYGNYAWQGWQAGCVTTFDWWNVPHATANAGHVPRATLQITGVITPATTEFLKTLRSTTSYQV